MRQLCCEFCDLNIITLKKCDFCGLYYSENIETTCKCRKITEG